MTQIVRRGTEIGGRGSSASCERCGARLRLVGEPKKTDVILCARCRQELKR